MNNKRFNSNIHWDDLILVVYSVLVGLSLDKSFDFFASSSEKISSAILLIGILIVVLENWVYLPIYFKVIDIDSTREVTMYLLAAIAYSCLPSLYLSITQQTFFTAPEWVMLNFVIICLIDSLTKLFTLRKLKIKYHNIEMPIDVKNLAGTYGFYAYTGIFYTILLVATVYGLYISSLNIIFKSVIVTVSWIIIRTTDKIVIPRTTNYLARAYLGDQ
jgi:hypothetical protein